MTAQKLTPHDWAVKATLAATRIHTLLLNLRENPTHENELALLDAEYALDRILQDAARSIAHTKTEKEQQTQ